jgi:hypothetical protein
MALLYGIKTIKPNSCQGSESSSLIKIILFCVLLQHLHVAVPIFYGKLFACAFIHVLIELQLGSAVIN